MNLRNKVNEIIEEARCNTVGNMQDKYIYKPTNQFTDKILPCLLSGWGNKSILLKVMKAELD